MFKKKKVNPNTTDTVIGEGTIFEGKIKSEAGVRIDGQLTGDIDCEGDITVGEKGVVKSNISGREVVIQGTVHGDIKAKTKLIITSSGKLYGNTNAPSLNIEDGAIFTGSSKMGNTPAETESKERSEQVKFFNSNENNTRPQ